MLTYLILVGLLTMPEVSLAMGHVESNHNPLAVGDRGKSRGIFQVQGSEWGKVPKSTVGQYRQHDAILRELLSACGHDVMEAVKRYNGSGKQAKRYADKVRQRTLELTLMEAM